jgi:hypothetical protein
MSAWASYRGAGKRSFDSVASEDSSTTPVPLAAAAAEAEAEAEAGSGAGSCLRVAGSQKKGAAAEADDDVHDHADFSWTTPTASAALSCAPLFAELRTEARPAKKSRSPALDSEDHEYIREHCIVPKEELDERLRRSAGAEGLSRPCLSFVACMFRAIRAPNSRVSCTASCARRRRPVPCVLCCLPRRE